MNNFRADMRQVDRLQHDLEKLRRKGVPHAIRNGINRSAFATAKVWKGEIRNTLTTRNTYTVRSVRVSKAKGVDPDRLEARLGSIAPYMGKREKGETKKARGKHGVAFPTSAAAGQYKAVPRTRLVNARRRMAQIDLPPRRGERRSEQRQRLAEGIRRARAKGYKFAFLNGQRKGIFEIMGSKRRPKIRMVWSLERRSVRVPPMPTLGPSLKRARGSNLRIMAGSLRQQIMLALRVR